AQVLGIFVLCLDITAAKKAEGALREAQKMTAIGQLAGGLAHDFNNLLTVVVGNLRSLKNEVDANLAEEYIEPAIRAGDRFVNIGVTDTGTGIDPATLSRAFEPFFTTKPFGIGSGLGLSMVYGFVKQSGGHIRIVSDVGKGTCVSFLLPRAHRIPQVDTPAQ